MSDLIRLVDLETWAHIGVTPEERANRQRLLVTAELRLGKLTDAARTDDLARTIDYASVAEAVKAVALERPRRLVETLAEDTATALLELYPIRRVRLEVKKFILPETRYVAIEIERKASKTRRKGPPPSPITS